MPCEFKVDGVQDSCQFDIPEGQLIIKNGRKLCIFHTPYEWKLRSGNKKNNITPEERDIFYSHIYSLIYDLPKSGSTLNLRGVLFPDGIESKDIIFNQVIFDGAQFLGKASFEQSTFNGDASFRTVHFHKGATFAKAIFNGDAIFTSTGFDSTAVFSSAEFKGNARFNKSALNNAQFDRVNFYAECEYSRATLTFSCFEGITAESYMNFTDATFIGNATFIDALFKESVNFSSTGKNKEEPRYFMPVALFDGATFKMPVKFNNRKFTDTTSFLNAKFFRAPSFHNCDFHQDTIFEGAEFKDGSTESASAYRTLKQQMENFRARREEGKFYALEQRCLRNNTSIPKSVRIFSRLYDITSDYGQSIGRPLLLLIVDLLVFSLIYALIGHACCDFSSSIDWRVTGNMFELSIEQMVNPFWIWRIDNLPYGPDKWFFLVKCIATFQSLVTLAFLALFFLALRWRFKRG